MNLVQGFLQTMYALLLTQPAMPRLRNFNNLFQSMRLILIFAAWKHSAGRQL